MNRFHPAYWQRLRDEVKKEWYAQYSTWKVFVWKTVNFREYDKHDWAVVIISFVVSFSLCKLFGG